MKVTRAWGGGNGELMPTDEEFQSGKMKMVLETEGGDHCTKVGELYLMPLTACLGI